MTIITIILAIYTCISPFLFKKLYEPKPETPTMRRKKKKKPADLSPYEKYQADVYSNLEMWHGAGSYQNEVKVPKEM